MSGILITGANGLLGQKLVRNLANSPLNIVATGRGPQRYQSIPGQEYVALDLLDREALSTLVDRIQPDLIIHAAALTDVNQAEREQELCWQVNVDLVADLLAFAERHNSYFQYVSTDFVYGGDASVYLEGDALTPVNFYGRSKAAAENLVQRYPGAWSIIRTSLVLGLTEPPTRSNLLLWVRKNLEAGNSIRVVADQYRRPTLAEELAKGCLFIAENRHEGIYHIAGKDMLSPYEMALKIATFFKLDTRLIAPTNKDEFVEPAIRPLVTNISTEKIEALGYEPKSFEHLLRRIGEQLAERTL